MSNTDSRRVVTGQVRLSYVHLLKPRAAKPGDTPKYGVTILIPKTDMATRQRIDAAINAAIQVAIAGKWNGTRPAQPALPIHDGDGVRPNGEAFSNECRGHWVITASNDRQPEIVDTNINPIINPAEIYSGMYARVAISFFGYFNTGKKGIGCSLESVQKLADGEPLAGSAWSAADAFGGGAVTAVPNTGFPAPGYIAQPAPAPYQAPAPMPTVAPPVPAQPTPQVHVDAAGNQYHLINNQWVLVQPAPSAPAQPAHIDPITGKPLYGNVMGL